MHVGASVGPLVCGVCGSVRSASFVLGFYVLDWLFPVLKRDRHRWFVGPHLSLPSCILSAIPLHAFAGVRRVYVLSHSVMLSCSSALSSLLFFSSRVCVHLSSFT